MTLDEIREHIDQIDPQIRELLMKRMDCAYHVAEAKYADHSTEVYRADREKTIIEQLSASVPEDRRAQYIAIIRKIMEGSRMYQYGLLYDWNGEETVFLPLLHSLTIPDSCRRVTLTVTRENRPNAMSEVLSMIGDYGYNMEKMELTEENEEAGTVTFSLTVLGSLKDTRMKKLMFQLSEECRAFRILKVSE